MMAPAGLVYMCGDVILMCWHKDGKVEEFTSVLGLLGETDSNVVFFGVGEAMRMEGG